MGMSKYVIEGNRVFYCHDYFFKKPVLMPEADHSSFEVIDSWFAKDDRHVYFLYRVVDGADPARFIYLGGTAIDYWAKDRARAYHFTPTKAARQFRPLASESLGRFAILPNCRFSEYAGDAERIYRRGRLIRGAHAPSFHVMVEEEWGKSEQLPSCHFARDASRIYFNGQPIKEADHASFKVVREPGIGHEEFGVDIANAYYGNYLDRLTKISHDRLPAAVREHYWTKR